MSVEDFFGNFIIKGGSSGHCIFQEGPLWRAVRDGGASGAVGCGGCFGLDIVHFWMRHRPFKHSSDIPLSVKTRLASASTALTQPPLFQSFSGVVIHSSLVSHGVD